MDLPEISRDNMKEYVCHRIERPLAISGKLDDPLWARAEVVNLVDAVHGTPATQETVVRLLYTDTTLYIGFSCEDDYVWGTLYERDTDIFTEECVEAFLCPSGKLRQYYEINVSPLNTVFDAIILNGRNVDGSDRAFSAYSEYDCEGLVTKTFVDGELGIVGGARGWSAEYAIPFSDLIGHDHLSPEPGDEWRMNLYRIDAPVKKKQVLYSWSRMGARDFHLPWHFGRLRFD